MCEEFDKNTELAIRAIKEMADRSGISYEEISKIETKDGRYLVDRADMKKMFALVGREMSEGTLGPISESERDTIDEEVRDIRAQIEKANDEGDSKRANQLYQKEQKLLARLGDQPVVGARGRAA